MYEGGSKKKQKAWLDRNQDYYRALPTLAPSFHWSEGGLGQGSNARRREGVDSGCSLKHFYNMLLLQAIACDCQVEKKRCFEII
jgi:hypothetical protein